MCSSNFGFLCGVGVSQAAQYEELWGESFPCCLGRKKAVLFPHLFLTCFIILNHLSPLHPSQSIKSINIRTYLIFARHFPIYIADERFFVVTFEVEGGWVLVLPALLDTLWKSHLSTRTEGYCFILLMFSLDLAQHSGSLKACWSCSFQIIRCLF